VGTREPESCVRVSGKVHAYPQPRILQGLRPALQSRVLHPRVCRPHMRVRFLSARDCTGPTKPTKLHADPQVASVQLRGDLRGQRRAPCSLAPQASSPACQLALPSSTSPAPKPRGSRAPGGAGAGRGRGGCRAAPAQKAESPGEGARAVSAVLTVPWRSQREPRPRGAPRTRPAYPGPAPWSSSGPLSWVCAAVWLLLTATPSSGTVQIPSKPCLSLAAWAPGWHCPSPG
jgi:hypothetical protein